MSERLLAGGVSFRISGGNALISFNNGGYIEEGDYRYTCQSAGGCQVTNGTVESGTIVQTSTTTMPEDTQPSFAGGSGPGNQTYTVGAAIGTLTLQAASGGDGTLTYSLSPSVPGLTFNATTRQFAGTPTAAGTHAMTYTVTDTDGDTDTLSFTITVQEAVSASPDLVVQSPSVSDASPEPGVSITISAAVRNQGAGESAATTLRYYRSGDATITTGDTEVGTGAVSALAASTGSDESISLMAPSAAGTYYYGACVDLVSGESHTGNNCSTAVLVTVGDSPMEIEGFDLASVNPWPTGIVFANDRFYAVDLVAAKVYAYQSSGERDTAFDIDLDSANGNATGLTFANDRLFVADWNDAKVYAYQSSGGRDAASDFDLDSANVRAGGMTFGNDRFYVVDWQAAKVYAYQSSGQRDAASDFDLDSANGNATGITFGNDRFFVVDSADDKAYAYQSSGQRDTASDLDLDSANGRAGGITFANNQLFVVDSDADRIYAYSAGAAPEITDTDSDGIGDDVDTDDDNDGVADTDDAFPLDPDESVDTDGDGTGDNADTDDDNDGVSDTDDAFPLDPDRSVDSQPSFGAATVSNATYTAGGAISTLTLPAASGGDGTLTYSLSPSVPGLTFNATTRQLTGTPTAAGAHAMTYTVRDSDGDTASLSFTITVEDGGVSGSPDLVVQSPAVSDASPEPGASITLTATVRNQGAGESAATTLRYYRSTDTTITTADTEVGTDVVSALAAAAISDESIGLTAPSIAGTYYYGACVDPVSGETDTGNNCSSAATVTVTGSGSIAPMDSQAFNRLMLGNRLSAESFFLDIVSDGRFVEDGRIPGSYSYASTDLNTGTLNLTYDQGNYGGGCVIQLTFASSSSGSLRFTCESGLMSQEDWRLSEFGLLPGPRLAPRTGTDTALDATLTGRFEARETKAYDIQFRTKSPRGSWRQGCNTFTNNSSSSVTGRFTAGIGNLQPGTVYQVRYRYRNSSSCSSGSPDAWSDIREGRTSGEVTLGFSDGESTTRSVPENSPSGINVGIPVAAVSADTVTYSLSGPDASSFAIVSETGQIRTTEGIIYDFESKSRYTVTVAAEGDNGESDTISVTILLQDLVPSCTPLSDVRIDNANQRLTVRWDPPTETSGQAPLLGYETEIRRGDNATWGQGRTILGRNIGATIYSNLVNGIEYQIRVRPINREGDCEWSIPVSGIPTGEHAPKDADELIDRFDTHPVGSRDRNWRFLTSERCRHHRNGVTLDADCMYQNTGPDTGKIFLEFDDPSQGSCEISLAYSSLTAGSFIDECFDAGVNTNVPFDRSFRMPALGPPPEGQIDVPRAPRTTEEFEVLAWGRDDFIPGLFFGCFSESTDPGCTLGSGYRVEHDPVTGVSRYITGDYTYENTGPSQGVITFQADDGGSHTFTLDFEPSGSMRVTITDAGGADSEWPGLVGFGAQPILLPIPPSWPAAIAVETDFAPDDWEGLEYDHSTASDDPGAFGGIARALFGGLHGRVFDQGNGQPLGHTGASANYEKIGRNRAVVTYEFDDDSEGFFRDLYDNLDDFGKELSGSTWTYELRFTSDGTAEFTLTITKDGHLPTVVEGVADFRGDGIDISEFPDELLLPDDPPQASGEDRSGIEIAAAVSTSRIGSYGLQPFLVNNSGAQPISYSPGDWLEPKDGSNQRMMIVAADPVSASAPAALTRVATPQLQRQTFRTRASASPQGPTPFAAAMASLAVRVGLPDYSNSNSTITQISVVCMQQVGDIPKRGGRYFSQPKTAQGAVQECQRNCVLDEALSIQGCVWNCERTTDEPASASIATEGLDDLTISEVIGAFKGQELQGEQPGVPAIIGRPGGLSKSTEIDIDSASTYFH